MQRRSIPRGNNVNWRKSVANQQTTELNAGFACSHIFDPSSCRQLNVISCLLPLSPSASLFVEIFLYASSQISVYVLFSAMQGPSLIHPAKGIVYNFPPIKLPPSMLSFGLENFHTQIPSGLNVNWISSSAQEVLQIQGSILPVGSLDCYNVRYYSDGS